MKAPSLDSPALHSCLRCRYWRHTYFLIVHCRKWQKVLDRSGVVKLVTYTADPELKNDCRTYEYGPVRMAGPEYIQN